MARYCPLKDGPALYLDCKECDDKDRCDDLIAAKKAADSDKPKEASTDKEDKA